MLIKLSSVLVSGSGIRSGTEPKLGGRGRPVFGDHGAEAGTANYRAVIAIVVARSTRIEIENQDHDGLRMLSSGGMYSVELSGAMASEQEKKFHP